TRGSQAVTLSAPTGSGKTVVATAAIERLFYGDEDAGPQEDAVVLWITDQLELNLQTLNKMRERSDIPSDSLVAIDEDTFDQPELEPGNVYFINTQKLAVTSRLIHAGDGRTHTFWQTMRASIDAHPSSLYVFIDEAHRGTSEGKDRTEATTIIQK